MIILQCNILYIILQCNIYYIILQCRIYLISQCLSEKGICWQWQLSISGIDRKVGVLQVPILQSKNMGSEFGLEYKIPMGSGKGQMMRIWPDPDLQHWVLKVGSTGYPALFNFGIRKWLTGYLTGYRISDRMCSRHLTHEGQKPAAAGRYRYYRNI